MPEISEKRFALQNSASALAFGALSSVMIGRFRYESDSIVYDDISVIECAGSLHASEFRKELDRIIKDREVETLKLYNSRHTASSWTGLGQKSITWSRGARCTIGTLRFAPKSELFIALATCENDADLSWKREMAQLVLYEEFRRQKFTGDITTYQDWILNQLDQGVMIVDEFRDVIYLNELASLMLSDSPNVTVEKGEFIGRCQLIAHELEDAVLAATTAAEVRTLALPNVNLVHPEVITFIPASTQPGYALVCFGRCTDVDPKITESVLKAFGLTPAECRVALSLQRGASVNEIACKTRLKVTTTRGYLKRIFMKIGARRQPELVSFVNAKVPAFNIPQSM